jgi:hypothetical protein
LARVKQTADLEQFQIADLHVRLGLPARELTRKLEVSVARVDCAKYKIGTRLKREIEQFQREGGPC